MAGLAFFIGLETLSSTWLQHAAAKLMPADKHRLASFEQPKRQREFIAARTLLNALAHSMDSPGQVAYFPSGKPYWKTNAGNSHCALSHSHNGVLVGLDSQHSIGVDIETQRARALDALANRYFHPVARSAFYKAQGKERLDVFYHWWCSREALVKYDDSIALLPRLKALWPKELPATLIQFEQDNAYLSAVYEGPCYWYSATPTELGFDLIQNDPNHTL
jgi:phosphopantetheinyl transferase